MPVSASTRKSVTDITRRRTRAFFTVSTLAIAVASVSIFGVSSLMQEAMQREITATALADLTLSTKPLVMTDQQVRAVGKIPNVTGVQPKAIFSTRVLVGARRQRAVIIGLPDFAVQRADRVTLVEGRSPDRGELLSELQNAARQRYEGVADDVVRVLGADGRARSLRISGQARYLGGGQLVTDPGIAAAVFYADSTTVADLSGTPGYTMLALRLRDSTPSAAQRTAAAVRQQLLAIPGFDGLADLPEIRAPGDYPGKELFDQITTIMTVVTVLALLSAMMLVSNTMTTLVGEQVGEIAAMKAIGARRRQISNMYRRTALILGSLGAVIGSVLGVVLANAVTAYFGHRFYGISAGFHVDPVVLLASLGVGLIGAPLAAYPAIRRAARLPLADALEAQGPAVGGQGAIDRAIRRARFLPRTAQIGLRGAARRKRRTAVTAAQIGLAVGTLLSLLALGTSVGRVTHAYFDDSRWDIWLQTYASKPFDRKADVTVASMPGVREVQPLLTNAAKISGTTAHLYGLSDDPMYLQRLTAGRWYTSAEAGSGSPVIVIGGVLAERAGAVLGDTIPVQLASGTVAFRVVGITTNEVFQGTAAYLPIASLQTALGTPGTVNNLWVRANTADRATIDRLASRLEDAVGSQGNQATTVIRYVSERESVAGNAGITSAVTVLGLLIVAISLVGLVNAITMGVIERTREIGMLRCVGASAGDVRRIFIVEGLATGACGWVVGVPLGWALAHGIVFLTKSTANIDLPFSYPAGHVALTLLGTIALTLVVSMLPVRRAVRLHPGDALRYA